MFVEGQWVRVTDRSWSQTKLKTAYVISHKDNGVMVQIYIPEEGRVKSVSKHHLERYEDILPEAKEAARVAFVDMALDYWNEEWFMEVTDV